MFAHFRRIATAFVAAVTLLALPAAAEMVPSSENGRYILRKTENGWFRMDTQNGQASVCAEGSGGFSCQMVPDDREAMLDEIERLNDHITILERQIELAGEDVAQAPSGQGEAQAPEGDLPSFIPGEERMDEIMQGFEGMVRRFLAMVRSLREEYGQGI